MHNKSGTRDICGTFAGHSPDNERDRQATLYEVQWAMSRCPDVWRVEREMKNKTQNTGTDSPVTERKNKMNRNFRK